MKVERKLLPIKGHYFFFMAALGPILPQLSVYGKELGISSVVMGTITGILPFAFLIAKPAFGLLVDWYRDYRKFLFMSIIVFMCVCYALLYFIPIRSVSTYQFDENFCPGLGTCNVTMYNDTTICSRLKTATCSSSLEPENDIFIYYKVNTDNDQIELLCSYSNETKCNNDLNYTCKENEEIDHNCLYLAWEFWTFIILMSLGTIAFNVGNSVSDAICFDVIGEEFDYGKQRVWGTIGFGITALISGYIVNIWSDTIISYTPAFIVMIIFTIFDLMFCFKLQLPIIKQPDNIFKDIKKLLNNKHTITFICFAVIAGILDGFIIYFLFWYLEDLSLATNTENIKLLEGLIVAAETLGGEVIFFMLSGKILDRFGHTTCFSMCFIFYAIRLSLISIAKNPWWILLVEFVLQGPTYALTYSTIVAYANNIAPPGASATMQGIAAGMDDGFGYALGSILGGLLYKYIGGAETFQIFAIIGLIGSITHVILHKTVLIKHENPQKINKNISEYKSPKDATSTTYEEISLES